MIKPKIFIVIEESSSMSAWFQNPRKDQVKDLLLEILGQGLMYIDYPEESLDKAVMKGYLDGKQLHNELKVSILRIKSKCEDVLSGKIVMPSGEKSFPSMKHTIKRCESILELLRSD
jgi:hypothetical protein